MPRTLIECPECQRELNANSIFGLFRASREQRKGECPVCHYPLNKTNKEIRKEIILESIRLFAILYIVGMFLTMLINWFKCFFDSNQTIYFTINEYGEAYPELVLHIIGLISIAILVHHYIYQFNSRRFMNARD